MIAETVAADGGGWVAVWTLVLLAACALFGGMGLIVSVGAVRDLIAMLRDLARKRDEPEHHP